MSQNLNTDYKFYISYSFNDTMSSLLIVERFQLHMDLALYKIKIYYYYYKAKLTL